MGLLTPCIVPRGGFLYRMIVPGEGFCSLQVVSLGFVQGGGMGMDEIDTCITVCASLQIINMGDIGPWETNWISIT